MVRVLVCAVLVAYGAVVPRWYLLLARCYTCWWSHWRGPDELRAPRRRAVLSPGMRLDMATWWMHSSELGVHERPVPARASSLTRTAVMEGILLKRRELVVVAADFVEDEGDAV